MRFVKSPSVRGRVAGCRRGYPTSGELLLNRRSVGECLYIIMYAREVGRNAVNRRLSVLSSLVVGMWWGTASLIIGRVWQRMCTFVPK